MSPALLLALLAPLAPGTDPVATVPMKEWNGLVLVPVSVQGSDPFHLLLDTAMSLPGIVLSQGPRLDVLDLDFIDGPRIAAAGGDGNGVATRQAKASRIDFGGLTLSDVSVAMLPQDKHMPADIDGVIGFELFHRYAVHVDRERGIVALFNSATVEPAPGSTVIPLEISNGYPYVQLMVAISRNAVNQAQVIVDLGAVHALWLNNDQGRFAPPAGALETSLGFGAAGRVVGHVGRSWLVQLGGVSLEHVVTVFPEPIQRRPGGFDIRDGFIGADLLSRFDVTIDYPGQRLVLGETRIDAPFEWDMSGLMLNPSGGGLVDSVEEGSAAEQAGILVGDVVVSVDDRSFAEVYGAGLRQIFRRDGAEVRLVIQRGDERLEKRLRLKRLI